MVELRDVLEMPETTAAEIIKKIYGMASSIRGDWTDPRTECREIWRLCDLLHAMIVPHELAEAGEQPTTAQGEKSAQV